MKKYLIILCAAFAACTAPQRVPDTFAPVAIEYRSAPAKVREVQPVGVKIPQPVKSIQQ